MHESVEGVGSVGSALHPLRALVESEVFATLHDLEELIAPSAGLFER
jgi:hypothetical protein